MHVRCGWSITMVTFGLQERLRVGIKPATAADGSSSGVKSGLIQPPPLQPCELWIIDHLLQRTQNGNSTVMATAAVQS